ncbi:hypothetical protein C3941_19505 [Kaistia algarum]|uniref:hypothetical protein n=1 Tax=Kaistia algarum TaxID=2083279 RepID=UPI000CE7F940|nr:hypothetical protein [Kaistia algarum]MCX5516179.1 hypothetical protein [Kaistia algarum]PPE78253.1 hypothetical protein C3941_19505 [Kaistia algarum]
MSDLPTSIWPISPVPHPDTWRYDQLGSQIVGASAKGGDTLVIDIRGWGYLTGKGHGALGLSFEPARAAQDALAEFIIAACRAAASKEGQKP